MIRDEKREFNRGISYQNKDIVVENSYRLYGKTVKLDHSLSEHKEVTVLNPDLIKDILSKSGEVLEKAKSSSGKCKFVLTNGDSYSAETDIVLNFASAVHPGGGYLTGANAQEEALCRQSTLYASIGSRKASEMYRFNIENRNPADSDYMLISPCVEIFRDVDCNLISKPCTTAVITAPAPNLKGHGSSLSESELHELMKHRIRNLLVCAAHYGYRSITLGAWGCGAFGHNPADMAGYFREVLIDEQLSGLFDRVVFAILDEAKRGENYLAFKRAFSDVLPEDNQKAEYDLERFLKAQERDYKTALSEIKSGRKTSHWIWYIFPQIRGLGHSSTAKHYELADIDEAKAYAAHFVLFPRLMEITAALFANDGDIRDIVGSPDHLKIKSCMTLFYLVSGEKLFKDVLDKFYGGEMCEFTKKAVQSK